MAEEKTNPTPEKKPDSDKGGNWFSKHKGLTIGGVVVAVIVAIIALGGGNASFDVSVGGPSSDCHYEDKDLCKFLNEISETDSVAMSMEMESEGTTTKSTIKIQGTDRTQLATETGGTELNIITIDKTIYAKQADGSWNKYVDEADELDTGSNTDWKGDLQSSLDETSTVKYEKIGEEECDSMNCIKYRMTDSNDPTLKTILLFDDKKFLLRKAISEAEGQQVKVTYSYDDVDIEAPSDAKEVSSPAELYGGIGL